MEKFAVVFPGQGAQKLGMGKDFYEEFFVARELFQRGDDALKFHLSRLIFEGPFEKLTLTKYAQPALYVTSLAIWSAIQKQFPALSVPTVCGGLSLGEYSAACAAEKLSFEAGLDLVWNRGQYMHQASLDFPGTMSVVLGGEVEAIALCIERENLTNQVWIANLNCPGQIVLSGTYPGIKAMQTLLIEKKLAKRVLPLDVSGAFHSGLMQSAKKPLAEKVAQTHVKESPILLGLNVSGVVTGDIDTIRTQLVDQINSPVLWEKEVQSMERLGTQLYIECGPGKTLQGMNKKMVKTPTIAINTIRDLESLSQFLHETNLA